MQEMQDITLHKTAEYDGMPEALPSVDLAELSEDTRGGESQDALMSAGWQAIQELEDLRRVSARLFPRDLPRMADTVYAGVCMEAHHAGGDFYDFFDCGPNRLGVAVGDVSGNGVASAVLRATLQASLRTLRLMGMGDFQRSLALANQLLYRSAPEAMYASLFLAEYDERSRRLRYVNCGHPAPALAHDEEVIWLQPTATVLGLFSEWQCTVGEAYIEPGDTLLLYTDGVTEATDTCGEEFGPDRLLAVLRAQSDVPLSMLLQECLSQVRRFSQGNLCDDLTLVVLRCLEHGR